MAAAPGRRRAALLVRASMALFVCAAVASLADAQTIKVMAYDARDISEAFQQLSRAYKSTTRPGTVTLQLNLACDADGGFKLAQRGARWGCELAETRPHRMGTSA